MITQEAVLDIAREAIYTTIITSAPLLLISLIVGLIVSIFQTVTSIQEQTLTFVPKIIAIFLATNSRLPPIWLGSQKIGSSGMRRRNSIGICH